MSSSLSSLTDNSAKKKDYKSDLEYVTAKYNTLIFKLNQN